MEVFSVKELANYLKCSESSIRNMVREKKIPSFRINRKLNFSKETIDLWVHNQELTILQSETNIKK